jgi:hypothetical protein
MFELGNAIFKALVGMPFEVNGAAPREQLSQSAPAVHTQAVYVCVFPQFESDPVARSLSFSRA